MLCNSFSTEIFPNTQCKPPFTQLEAIKQTLARAHVHPRVKEMSCTCTPSTPPCRQLLQLVQEPAEEQEHARLPVIHLKGIVGEQECSQRGPSEKPSEHEAPSLLVGQALEGWLSCSLGWHMDKSKEAARDEATCSEETCKRVSSVALASCPTFPQSSVCLQAGLLWRGSVSKLRSWAVSQSSYNLSSMQEQP